LPDQPFTGCGADVGKELGIRPSWILDVHNGGCVSFVAMMAQAQALMSCYGLRTALLCNVQNAAGRMFASEQTRKLKQARVPGDGCSVGYLVASGECPVKAVVQHNHCEYAGDMKAVRTDGTEWWPSKSPIGLLLRGDSPPLAAARVGSRSGFISCRS
jgi:3-oxoacyl-[acyl-carrier-protein] synthase-3